MTRYLMIAALGLALALASWGCTGQSGERTGSQEASAGSAESSSPDRGMVEEAIRIAKELRAQPDEMETVLKRHGKTREEFEKLLFEIAADPELSRIYNQGVAE